MSDTRFVSRYDKRIAFVQEVLYKNSELDVRTSRELAVQVVHALDRIPETMR